MSDFPASRGAAHSLSAGAWWSTAQPAHIFHRGKGGMGTGVPPLLLRMISVSDLARTGCWGANRDYMGLFVTIWNPISSEIMLFLYPKTVSCSLWPYFRKGTLISFMVATISSGFLSIAYLILLGFRIRLRVLVHFYLASSKYQL